MDVISASIAGICFGMALAWRHGRGLHPPILVVAGLFLGYSIAADLASTLGSKFAYESRYWLAGTAACSMLLARAVRRRINPGQAGPARVPGRSGQP